MGNKTNRLTSDSSTEHNMAASPSKDTDDCFEYPYEQQNNILPEYKDRFDRPLARLVASFASFGKKVIKQKVLAKDFDIKLVESIVRMCEDSMQNDDFDVLIGRAPPLQGSRIWNRASNWEESLRDSQTCQQVIVPHSISQNKWLIYLVTLRTGTIDAYLIGDVLAEEEEPLSQNLQQVVASAFPDTCVSFNRRLHIRRSLKNDSVLTAYLLSWYLHSNGNYLDLDDHKINLHKFEVFAEFLDKHDKYLGSFLLDEDPKERFPFFVGKPQEDLKKLEKMGWVAIDVEGDGHCGYYALLLGLENIGKSGFSCKTKSNARRMRDDTAWQEAVIKFRQVLQTRSLNLLKKKINEGTDNEPEWWVNVIAPEEELSKEIFDPKLTPLEWWPQKKKLKDKYHMDFMWVPFVVASKFRIRVIVIMMAAAKGAKTTYTTNFFTWETPFKSQIPEKEKPHLSWKQQAGVVRISDNDFKKKPTIELLFLTGDTNHYLFLRRVICSNTHVVEINKSQTLKELLQQPNQLDQSQAVVEPNPIANNQPTTTEERVNEETTRDNSTQNSAAGPVETRITNNELRDNEEPLPDLENPLTNIENHSSDQEDSPNRRPRTPGNMFAEAIDIAAHQENPRKRKIGSGSGEKEPTSTKRTRQSTADAVRETRPPVAVAVRGKRPPIATKQTKGSRTTNRTTEQTTYRSINRQMQQYEIDQATIELDKRYREDTLKHDSCVKMLYDAYGRYFMVQIYDFDKEKFLRARREDNVRENYDNYLVDLAILHANMWVGNSPGDPGVGNPAPTELCTKIPTIYQQHNRRFCLTYSFASALFYCGFKDEARVLSSLADTFSTFHFDQAIDSLIDFMRNLLPEIGRPTIYQRRTKSQLFRRLTIDDVLNDFTPHPTIIIPVLSGGSVCHALCVVDDLIFDSITPFALHLKKESFSWIFNNCELKIYLALRFATKVSPQGSKIDAVYNRKMVFHSDNSQIVSCSVEKYFIVAPDNIATEIPTMCQQHDARFALTYSLSSALYYRGFKDEAFLLASKAVELSTLPFIDIWARIKELMQSSIGQFTEYPKDSRKRKKRRGPLSWEDVLNNVTPYPTLIIPVLPDGTISLAFCVIDDLIFHSISRFALRLHKDTIQWLYTNSEPKIHKALRFSLKTAPKREGKDSID